MHHYLHVIVTRTEETAQTKSYSFVMSSLQPVQVVFGCVLVCMHTHIMSSELKSLHLIKH